MAAHDLPELAPLTAVLVLLELAAGTAAMTLLIDIRGRVSRGFMGTTSLICAAIVGLELSVLSGLPRDGGLSRGGFPGTGLDRVVAQSRWLALALVGYAAFCVVGTAVARRVAGVIALGAAAGALAAAVTSLAPALGGVTIASAAVIPAALLGGAALAGMLLGHWYLITPDLSFRPLREAIYVVFGAVAVEAVVILGAVALAARPAARMILHVYAVPFWLLVVGSGVLFTAGVTGLTWYFARIRANQPATAMLYVLIVTVVMGIVPGHLLLFLTGVPV